jgi:hypothetical protein
MSSCVNATRLARLAAGFVDVGPLDDATVEAGLLPAGVVARETDSELV